LLGNAPFSPVIRLSAVDLYTHRGGAAGSIDARLDALAWGIKVWPQSWPRPRFKSIT